MMKRILWLYFLLFGVVFETSGCPQPCACPSPGVVTCRKAGLTDIPSLPSSTISLDLGFNYITAIPDKAFAAAPGLKHLDIMHNKIASLSAGAFAGIPHLQNLSLSYNALSDDADFSSLSTTALIDLNLATNSFTRIPALQSTSLQRLILSSNSIRSAAFPSSFSSCASLLSIRLSTNQISSIGASDFDSLAPISVNSLSFAANRLTAIDPQAITAVGLTLTELNLNGNRLTADALAAALQGFRKVGSIALLSISFSGNAITDFGVNVLAPLAYTLLRSIQMDGHRRLKLEPGALASVSSSLMDLSLRDCGLSVPPEDLASLPSLSTLRLDGNPLGPQLPSNLPSSLKELYLSRCGLQGWSASALSPFQKLQQLDISQNDISTVSKASPSPNPLGSLAENLKFLALTKNPFSCTCDLAWFVTWAKMKTKVVQNYVSYSCATPPDVAGTRLSNFDVSKCVQKSRSQRHMSFPVVL